MKARTVVVRKEKGPLYDPGSEVLLGRRGKEMLNSSRDKNEGTCRSGGREKGRYVTRI